MALTDSVKPLPSLDVSDEVMEYLKENNYITTSGDMIDVTNGQRIRCEELGNQVSKIMDEQIAQLPEGALVKIPQILAIHSPGRITRPQQETDDK